MDTSETVLRRRQDDRVSDVLKWTLLVVAVLTFALLAWATVVTYRNAPPQPARLVAPDGSVAMTARDITDGKASFQRADLMDYGSIYGMGLYFGEDYTAEYLLRLGQPTNDNIALSRFGQPFAALDQDSRNSVQAAMRQQLKGIDLSRTDALVPAEVARAIRSLRVEISRALTHHDFIKGWTQAYSLDERHAAKTADFLLYAAPDDGGPPAGQRRLVDAELAV